MEIVLCYWPQLGPATLSLKTAATKWWIIWPHQIVSLLLPSLSESPWLLRDLVSLTYHFPSTFSINFDYQKLVVKIANGNHMTIACRDNYACQLWTTWMVIRSLRNAVTVINVRSNHETVVFPLNCWNFECLLNRAASKQVLPILWTATSKT